jgi:antitoxin component of MazEF toxin-antitoxin module
MERFITTTRKVGNSLGLLIPSEVIDRAEIGNGAKVEVTISTPVKNELFGKFKNRFSTADLDNFIKDNKDAWGD